jgi:phosphoribosyl-ATP pyrophosphohydrolase
MSDSLDRLHHAVLAARNADPSASRTARLLNSKSSKIAKKFGEEAVEVVVGAVSGDRDNVVRESADLLYNLTVLWVSCGINPKEVWAEMDRREELFGIAEKRLKDFGPKARRRAPSLTVHRLQKLR